MKRRKFVKQCAASMAALAAGTALAKDTKTVELTEEWLRSLTTGQQIHLLWVWFNIDALAQDMDAQAVENQLVQLALSPTEGDPIHCKSASLCISLGLYPLACINCPPVPFT